MPWLLVACCLAILGFVARTQAGSTHAAVAPLVQVDQAWRAEVPTSLPPVRGAFLTPGLQVRLPAASGLAPPPVVEPGVWKLSPLPDAQAQDLATSVEQDRAVSLIWYRMAYPGWGKGGTAQALAMYIPRCPGGALHVYARTAQGWTWLSDNREEWASQWNRPFWIRIPPAVVAPDGTFEVAIGIPHAKGAPHGLTRIWMGPQDAVHKLWAWRWALQITAPQVISLTILVLGLFSLFAWFKRCRRRFKSDHLCRLNFDQGLVLSL